MEPLKYAKSVLLVRFVTAGCLLFAAGCAKRHSSNDIPNELDVSRGSSVVIEDPAFPKFSLPDTEGNQISLSSYRGKVVLLNFWATWCHTCTDEIRALDLIYKKYREQGFVVVAVAIDDSLPSLKRFKSENNIELPILVDTDHVVKKAFNLLGLPVMQALDRQGRLTSLIDPQSGEITERVSGVRDWGAASGISSIEQLLRRHRED